MPRSKIKIAVLLAAYNGMLWIEEQLASIQAQINVEIRIFISVDASTDGTAEWCLDYAKKHTNVSLLPPTDRGGGAAVNFFHLIREADIDEFDFVAFSDQDDHWHRDKLLRATTFLSANHTNAYSSNVTAFWPDGTTQLLDKAQKQVKWDHYFEAAGPGCTYVLDKSLSSFLKSQVKKSWPQLQSVTLHDWYIYALARSHGYTWYIDPVASMDYRQHENNQVGANVGLKALIARYQIIRNGWWFGQVKLIETLTSQQSSNRKRPYWQKLGRIDLIRLSVSARHCRRRPRDQLLFAILCLMTAVIGPRFK